MSDEKLPKRVQRDIDAVVAAFEQGRKDTPAFNRLVAWLEKREQLGSLDYAQSFQALPPWEAESVFAELDAEEISWESKVPTLEEKLDYFECEKLDQLYNDADLCPGFGAVDLQATSGKTAVLICSVRGYSFSEISREWHGPVRSFDDFENSLKASGWIFNPWDFRALPRKEKLRVLGVEIPKKRARKSKRK